MGAGGTGSVPVRTRSGWAEGGARAGSLQRTICAALRSKPMRARRGRSDDGFGRRAAARRRALRGGGRARCGSHRGAGVSSMGRDGIRDEGKGHTHWLSLTAYGLTGVRLMSTQRGWSEWAPTASVHTMQPALCVTAPAGEGGAGQQGPWGTDGHQYPAHLLPPAPGPPSTAGPRGRDGGGAARGGGAAGVVGGRARVTRGCRAARARSAAGPLRCHDTAGGAGGATP